MKQEDFSYNTTYLNKKYSTLNSVLVAIVILLVFIFITLLFILSPMTIMGESMVPTFNDGDHIFVLKIGYDLHHNDIVIFNRPDSEFPPIKRIIGLPGDKIQFNTKELCYYRNGKKLEEKYINSNSEGNFLYDVNYFSNSKQDSKTYMMLITEGLIVGEDEVFVLGDNRNISLDSHIYGCIKIDWIKGKYVIKY